MRDERQTAFRVRVSRGNGDWLVTIDHPDSSEYAKTLAPDLETALKMAVPYMASIAQPDPLTPIMGWYSEERP